MTRDEFRSWCQAADDPLAGWLAGIVACVAFALVGLLLRGTAFSALVAAAVCTIATLVLTAAAHEHALARFADRVGGHGHVALTMTLVLKVALLAVIDAKSAAGVLAALWSAHTLSRLAPQFVEGRPLDRDFGIAVAWCLPPLAAAVLARGPVFALLGTLLAALAAWAIKRYVPPSDERGGATQQACEVAFYFGAAIA